MSNLTRVSKTRTVACLIAACLLINTASALHGGVQPSWEEAVYKAAEAAVQAVRLQSGAQLSLREVPLDTLQVYTGRQHQLGLSIDGIQYEVVLGSEQELSSKFSSESEVQEALPVGHGDLEDAVPSGLVRQHWQAQGEPGASQRLALPDVSLSGPLELTLAGGPAPVAFFTPHAVDMGPVQRIRLAAGVTVKVSGLRSIQLRGPLDLPALPVGFLAEVYAHAKLKDPGEGFDKAPGIHFLADQLRAAALNSTAVLLSLEVEPADRSLGVVVSASTDVPGMAVPRLKVKRDKRGSVDLTLRQGELTIARGSGDVVAQSSALARPWAWPLPHVDLSNLVPLEALLRSILAAHPFDLAKVAHQGIQMKLTKSEITGTRLMAFEMEVRSRAPPTAMPEGMQHAYEDGIQFGEEQLMLFDVVVSVKEKAGAKAAAGAPSGPQDFVYVPVSVKLKKVFGSTLSMSQGTLQAMLQGTGNQTTPYGYDHQDLGVARQEAD